MKRDMDLVRKILFELQARSYLIAAPDVVTIDGYDDSAIEYHLLILTDSPYVMAKDVRGIPNYYRLTWQGHEFLDSIADPGRWDAIKRASNTVGGFTFEIIAKVAAELITKAMAGQLNI